MSSMFFRPANEISSSLEESSSSDAGKDAPTEGFEVPDANKDAPFKDLEASGAAGPPPQANVIRSTSIEELSSSLSHAGVDPVQQHQKDGIRDGILHALLEEKCLNEAVDQLNRSLSGQNARLFTKDDPEVRNLAASKYNYMAENLKATGITTSDMHTEENKGLRDNYRQALDYVSQKHDRALRQPQEPRQSIQRSVTSTHLPNQLKSILNPSTTNPSQLNHSRQASLPRELKPLVDQQHPMLNNARRVRDFVELGTIGKGGYGVVYKVLNPLDGGHYAIKQIPLSPARMEAVRRRGQAELDDLLREVRTMQQLDHPNIVRYHNAWLEQSNEPFSNSHTSGKLLLEGPEESSMEESESNFEATGSKDDNISFGYQNSPAPGSEEAVVFEDLSAESTKPSKQVRIRSESMATVSSTISKKSTVHSVGDEDDEEIEMIPRDLDHIATHHDTSLFERSAEDDLHEQHVEEESHHGASSQGLASPRLILHIQMALYALTLADYLSFSSASAKYRHCFHSKISLQILLAILDGVQYLHAKGVAHRDLKPANIFLSPLDGDEYHYRNCVDLSKCGDCPEESRSRLQLGVKIGDFGLVTAIAYPDEAVTLAHTKAVGTEFYRPPVTSGRENAKLDVFALGVIAFELLWPFETRMERVETLKDLKLCKLPADFTTKMGKCGDELADCIMGMLCREETARFSCSEVQRRLEAIVQKLEAEDST